MSLPPKTSATILCLLVFMGVLQAMKVMQPFRVASVLDFMPRNLPMAPPPVELKPKPAKTGESNSPPRTGNESSAVHLLDPAHALDPFYKALQQTEAGRHVTRVLHYGDSPVTADSITADTRSLLQERFGDSGHGFVLIAKPWAWYNHRGVEIHSGGWRSQPASQGDRAKDGFHGLGGVAFEGGAGAYSIVRLESPHNRVEVSYLKQPHGGAFTLAAGERQIGAVDTANSDKAPGWADFELPPGTREIRLNVQSGLVRIFGVSFEKSANGLIYNSLGLNGGQVQVVLRYFNPAQWTEQLRHQRPDLVVINYGTNETVYPKYLQTAYPGELQEVIRRVKAALPDAAVLVMSPMDRGQKGPGGQIATVPAVQLIVDIQRQIAAQTGCAFFNTFQAMGGEGAMARWYSNQPQMVAADFMHPFPAGARKIGLLLDQALLNGFARYKAAHRGAVAVN